MKYVILFRGINVGGNRRVSMPELRKLLTEEGFNNVVSYINSGNVIFESDDSKDKVIQQMNDLLQENYDFTVEFLVLDKAEYLADLAQAPEWWNKDDTLRHNALFILPTFKDEYRQLILDNITGFDQVEIADQMIFWTAPFKVNYSKSFFSKSLAQPFYKCVSIRNSRTTLKIADLLKDENR
ncbi:DUF1697 domain-containing protein [Companilactobacillus mishanensis]|uniref:DUF1697 domain-containing protein n=1 Tax=Companilactobacillus mishanensis TaxID=2486008 RepID=UPI0012972999|nr:DUF1697 domain-containing protein [Companilactobacillus mishanensis]MQS89328.1 DUF1697 domain-containing protein [Companilactobacillus mishanensis]